MESIKPILPWIVILGGFILFVPFASYVAVRRAWRGQPALELQQTMELNDAGLSMDDKQSRSEYTWDAFIQFLETRNLFLLFPSKLTFFIIPKRAVPPTDLDMLREMLSERISRNSAFPVLPPKSSEAAQ